jgi:acyl carrier protein
MCHHIPSNKVDRLIGAEMTNRELFEDIKTVIVDVIDDENIGEITEATTAQDIEAWDSLQHVRILMALERKFRFRFSNEEIETLRNVGDLVVAISRHIDAAV